MNVDGCLFFTSAGLFTGAEFALHVGMNRVNGRLTGDVDPVEMARLSSAYTPVPGGVGPLTIAMLMSNTVRAAEQAQ